MLSTNSSADGDDGNDEEDDGDDDNDVAAGNTMQSCSNRISVCVCACVRVYRCLYGVVLCGSCDDEKLCFRYRQIGMNTHSYNVSICSFMFYLLP